jgi:hypothetical protein
MLEEIVVSEKDCSYELSSLSDSLSGSLWFQFYKGTGGLKKAD